MKGQCRAKAIHNGQWYYGAYFEHQRIQPYCWGNSISEEENTEYLIIQDGFADWGLPKPMQRVDIEPNTVGRCSEYPDKNLNWIYEDDIVEITRDCVYEKGVVIFKEGCFFVKVKETLLPLYKCKIDNFKLKIIGNLHDNKNLLG